MTMTNLFDIAGKTIAITGGGGVLCGGIAAHLGQCGARVAVLDLNQDAAEQCANQIRQNGGDAVAVVANVLERESVEAAFADCTDKLGKIDILINGAGGNHKSATTSPELKFFDLPVEAFQTVMNLNIIGTVLPSMVFGRAMADRGEGVVLNVASMNAYKPLTKIPAYSAAKGAVKNFTEWLSVHMAQEYSPDIRVNAIAPGFFLTKQNRFLLTEQETGNLTPRGQSIISHTPMNRFGDPEDLYGTVVWLISPASQFITGITVPVDGGYSAFGGV
jgi:NAD(P)-dependent dehydrogenase (short-subunit alcohol dehydrogenase family)